MPAFSRPSRPPSRSRLFRAGFALALATMLTLAGTAPPAQAQDAVSDFFGSLFGTHRAPPPRSHSPQPTRHPKPPHATSAPAPATPASAPAERPPASFFVAVIGDSEAAMLAQGLAEAFAGDPRVAILNKARDDTGLVREDFFDWPQAVNKLLEGPQHIDMAVIQIGINDNQKLRIEGGIDPLSKPFNEIYAKRVEEIAAAFRDKNVPLVWVGLPIMRSESLSNAALVFNDIDRQYAGALGARYVDLWEAFSDVNSTYKAWGPDVNGDIVRQRAMDGVHFNKAGARKAAHFVEPEIRHLLEAALQPAPAPGEAAPSANPAPTLTPAPGENAPQPPEAVAPPPKPLAGKIEPLTEPVVSPGGELTKPGGALVNLPAPAPAPAASEPQPGRADDFRWPQK
jgi:uncharacterized protein